MQDSKGVPLNSPVPESLYPTLAVTLLSLGLGATGMFFVYVVVAQPAQPAQLILHSQV